MKKWLILLFIGISISLFSQEYLIQISHKRTGKYKLLKEGNILNIQKKNGEIRKGKFSHFDDSAVYFSNGNYVLKDQISRLGFYRMFWYSLAYKSFIFSAIYLGISSGNRMLNDIPPPLLRSSDFIVSGITMSIGLLSKTLSLRNYNLENSRWRIKFIKR
jgi:hypothetical protein